MFFIDLALSGAYKKRFDTKEPWSRNVGKLDFQKRLMKYYRFNYYRTSLSIYSVWPFRVCNYSLLAT